MSYYCCDERRRQLVENSTLNGIDFLEVTNKQLTLNLHMVKPLGALVLTPSNVLIDGGERIRNISVDSVSQSSNVVTINVDKRGDFSPYTLKLISSPDDTTTPPAGIDQRLASLTFSFKVECPSDLDCAPRLDCPQPEREEPFINYLAKDYSSFRQLMLDRMATIIPNWVDRNPAELSMMLVELLAYVGDHLSYQQDAVMTEAYLSTARQRISLRRHARLMDYLISEGNNARVWVHIKAEQDSSIVYPQSDSYIIPKGTRLLTRTSYEETQLPSDSKAIQEAAYVFETMAGLKALYTLHNRMKFYSWGDHSCCLPAGSTSATLQGHLPNLQVGVYLIFEEQKGPKTGSDADADPLHRHVVRLTMVQAFKAGLPLRDELLGTAGQQITEIEWNPDDRLPFPLCISAEISDDQGTTYHDDVSVALGNIVPADHGMTVSETPEDSLGEDPDRWIVPSSSATYAPTTGADPCASEDPVSVPVRFHPRLACGPLTHHRALEPEDTEIPPDQKEEATSFPSAAAFLAWDGKNAQPAVQLVADEKDTWTAKRDLLDSRENDLHFVPEIDDYGRAVLRFGDDTHGRRPSDGTRFTTEYRYGNGAAGNIGADALKHILIDSGLVSITEIRNPLAASCGRDPESSEDIRHRVPQAFRTQERAVTEEDYIEVAERHPDVQRAAASVRWTGSWHTVFLTIDRKEGREVDEDFKEKMIEFIEPYRCAGFDVEVDKPDFVALEITMKICVTPGYMRSDVEQELLKKFSASRLADGTLGMFHPDRFTFGQAVYASPLIAEAQKIDGVTSARLSIFQRLGTPDNKPLLDGVLPMNRLEIARLDNDPNFRENGLFRLEMLGGQ